MPAMTKPADASVPVAVTGAGRMGRHHARTYWQLPHARLAGVVDPDRDRAEELAEQYETTAYISLEALLREVPELAAASVAAPTDRHLEVAEQLLPRGIACLVEKPLASSSAEAQQLAELAEQCQTPLQVGHTERFNPAVRAVAEMDITPRFVEIDRVSPMSFRSLDVGVVMDMMIHDLDIVLMLAGSSVSRVDAAGIGVLGEHEDVANARLVFGSGTVANITASRLALKTERKMRLFSKSAYVSLDYQKRTGLVIRAADNAGALQELRQRLADGQDLSEVDYSQLVNVDQLQMDPARDQQDPLTAELTSFLEAVQGQGPPPVDGRAGLAAVAAAERIAHAIAEHPWSELDPAGQGET
jgi:predicted dehydrogenase